MGQGRLRAFGSPCPRRRGSNLGTVQAQFPCNVRAGIQTALASAEPSWWHAGASHWAGETDLNSASIGIEIAHPGHPAGLPDFPEAQIAATLNLCRDICD